MSAGRGGAGGGGGAMVAKPKFLPPAAVESELLRTAKAKDDAEAALQVRPPRSETQPAPRHSHTVVAM